MSYSERLKKCRNKRKLTQEQLSSLLKFNRSTYAKYETGENQPDYDTLQKLADFFEVSTDYLLGRTDDPSASISITGENIKLSSEELTVLAEMKKHPKFAAMFHDLATNPEKKVKTLIKMWEVIKADLDEDDDRNDIIED